MIQTSYPDAQRATTTNFLGGPQVGLPKVGQVEDQIGELGHALSQIRNELEVLEKRLTPVLLSRMGDGNSNKTSATEPVRCGHAARLFSLKTEADGILAAIVALNHDLEV